MRLPKRNKIDKKKKINLNFRKVYWQSCGFKPNGFWYSCYNCWYKWTQEEAMFQFQHKYIHKININSKALTNINYKNKNKILVIKNLKDFDTFNKKYGFLDKKIADNPKWKNYLINWKAVARDYGGIEICPYLTERSNYLWYYTFDVASGCIWNIKSIIKGIEPIYEKKKGEYVKVNT